MEWKIVGDRNDFEDMYSLDEINKIFLKKRGYEFLLPKPGEPVILLLSGGIDSIGLWGHLFDKYRLNVYPIHFTPDRDNQRGEEKSIRFFSNLYKNRYPKLFHDVSFYPIKFIFSFKNNLNKKSAYDLPISSNLIFNQKTGQYASLLSNNPSRLAYYAFGAYEHALKLRLEQNIYVKNILLGIIKDDSQFSRETTLTVLRSINLSLCLIVGDFTWTFSAPLEKKYRFFFTKKSLGQYALRSGVALEKTWSCSERSDVHCGQCANCYNRQNFYLNLHKPDPTRYLSSVIPKIKNLTKKFGILTNKFFPKKNVVKNLVIQPSSLVHVSTDLKCWEINNIFYRFNKQTGSIDKLNKYKSLIWRYIINSGPVTLSKLLHFLTKNKKTNAELINKTLIFVKAEAQRGYLTVNKK